MIIHLKKYAAALANLDKSTVNRINTLISICVFGTGLILFFKFHVGGGAHRKELLGLTKCSWLAIHQASAILFLVGLGLHIYKNISYIKTIASRWRSNLPEKIKKRTREQILFFCVAICVIFAGFYPWITLPGATLRSSPYHSWIDLHNYFGIAFLIGSLVHVKRRWRRLLK